ncbi:hypothetical protein ACFYZ9_28160 [Streptomyces sp. NPDC001691]|uniref:hypothetical protein n=1 Tax=Streptomyces sp. NPDC001691 TaxID=3364600 RepID=UPI003690C07C
MRTIDTSDELLISRLRGRLTDVRYYGLDNEYAGKTVLSDTAWKALDEPGTRLVEVNALLGIYKIVLDDHRWYQLRPAVEFEPLPQPPVVQAA